ncbi:9734_t:CDS:2, partial [Paraglomus occultum]
FLMSNLDYQKWSIILEESFLQLKWGTEAKRNTYLRNLKPSYIESVVRSYQDGDTSTQRCRCRGDTTDRAIFQQKIPGSKLVIRVVVVVKTTPWTVITLYSASARRYWDKNENQEPETSTNAGAPLLVTLMTDLEIYILLQFKRFITSAVYYDDSDALYVAFTEEKPEDIAEHATWYLL